MEHLTIRRSGFLTLCLRSGLFSLDELLCPTYIRKLSLHIFIFYSVMLGYCILEECAFLTIDKKGVDVEREEKVRRK